MFDDEEDIFFRNELIKEIQQTRLFFRSAISDHLNLNQSFQINTSEIIMFWEKIQNSNQRYENPVVSHPWNFTHSNQTILIEVRRWFL